MSARASRDDRMLREFGRRLRAARISAGYEEASDFASDLGIESPRYRKYERGEIMPPLDVLDGIVRLTERSLDWLLLGKRPAATTKG